MDQILGKDMSTDQPQVEGLSGNVVFVPTEIGTKLGKLVDAGLPEQSLDPCKVGYLYDIKASALDVAIKKSFDAAIAGSPVKVVAQGESFFTPANGLKAAQNMLQAHSDLNLIVGSDQGIEGAVRRSARRRSSSSATAAAPPGSRAWRPASGTATSRSCPRPRAGWRRRRDQGRQHRRQGAAASNPVADLPAEGVVTKANADQFTGSGRASATGPSHEAPLPRAPGRLQALRRRPRARRVSR